MSLFSDKPTQLDHNVIAKDPIKVEIRIGQKVMIVGLALASALLFNGMRKARRTGQKK